MNLRSNLSNIHQHTSYYRRRQPPPKRANAFLPGDPRQSPYGIGIVHLLAHRLGTIGAHPNQDHLGRVTNDTSKCARYGGGSDRGPRRQCFPTVAFFEVLREDAIQAETGGGIRGLAENRSREACPEGWDSCYRMRRVIQTTTLDRGQEI